LAVSIWWIRKDLRLKDNRALDAALAAGGQLLPLFILDPALFPSCPAPRKNFLLAGLQRLDEGLRERGSRLIVRSGKPLVVLRTILSETGGGKIFAELDYSPYAVKRDRLVAENLPVTFLKGNLRVPPGGLLARNEQPFKVFTPFARSWRALPVASFNLRPLPNSLPGVNVSGEAIPGSHEESVFPAGEDEALARLDGFIRDGINHYAEHRDRPDISGTSMLSPYLHFGMLSAERAIQSGFKAEKDAGDDPSAAASAAAWVNELAWREFFIHALFQNPDMMIQSYRPELRAIRWRNAPGELEAWKFGQTGCPIVDAGMRQMLATGWMHNRLRMITASFLVKDLLIDWREGERWFAKNLLDYDAAANAGGWQWTAGTGLDAAPYFRIFNPTLQGKKFDPEGRFVRRWVPELCDVADGFIHEPWNSPAGSRPKPYPSLIVRHSAARIRTLDAYQTSRNGRKKATLRSDVSIRDKIL
jgi:deoxyribodipyrimidine photo-lyase